MNRDSFIAALLLMGYDRYDGMFHTVMDRGDHQVRLHTTSRLITVHFTDDTVWTFAYYSEAFKFLIERDEANER